MTSNTTARAWVDANKSRLPTRAYNAIVNEIAYSQKTLFDIMQMTDAEWLRTPNFGRESLKELRKILPVINDDGADLAEECAYLLRLANHLETSATSLRGVATQLMAAAKMQRGDKP